MSLVIVVFVAKTMYASCIYYKSFYIYFLVVLFHYVFKYPMKFHTSVDGFPVYFFIGMIS